MRLASILHIIMKVMVPNNNNKVSVQAAGLQGNQAAGQHQKAELKMKKSSFDSVLNGASRTPRGSSKRAERARIDRAVFQASQKYQLPASLIRAVIKQESGFKPRATSHCGAQGLMQLMPATAKCLGVRDSYNIEQNVDGGSKYLRQMLDRYNGDTTKALAAYNAGPGAVDKYNGVPPYAETQNYVVAVQSHFKNGGGGDIISSSLLAKLSDNLAATQAAFAEAVLAGAMSNTFTLDLPDTDHSDLDENVPLPPHAVPV